VTPNHHHASWTARVHNSWEIGIEAVNIIVACETLLGLFTTGGGQSNWARRDARRTEDSKPEIPTTAGTSLLETVSGGLQHQIPFPPSCAVAVSGAKGEFAEEEELEKLTAGFFISHSCPRSPLRSVRLTLSLSFICKSPFTLFGDLLVGDSPPTPYALRLLVIHGTYQTTLHLLLSVFYQTELLMLSIRCPVCASTWFTDPGVPRIRLNCFLHNVVKD
jgi:hypothetical protein